MATVTSISARVKFDDSDDRDGTFELTLGGTPATVDNDFLTAVDAYAATGSATDGSKFNMAQVSTIQLVIEIEPTPQPNAIFGDIRDVWRLGFPSGSSRSLPGRNTAGILTTAESKGEFADKTQAAYTAWFTALFSAPPAGLGAVDPIDLTTPTSGDLEVRATTSTRARPRV